MAFVKGQSGNPSGRPKKDTEIEQMAMKLVPICMEKIQTILEAGSMKEQLVAIQIIFDRAFGKARQAVELSGKLESIVVNVVRKEPPKA